jgi:hypothetical protein
MKPFNFDVINKLRRENKQCIEDQGVYVSTNDALHIHYAERATMFLRKSVGCAIKYL